MTFCQSEIEKSNVFESRLFWPAICLLIGLSRVRWSGSSGVKWVKWGQNVSKLFDPIVKTCNKNDPIVKRLSSRPFSSRGLSIALSLSV